MDNIYLFELHYYFKDIHDHSINTFLKNKCEHEWLLLIQEFVKQININVHIESFAVQEGGFIESMKVITSDPLVSMMFGYALSWLPQKNSKRDLNEKNLAYEKTNLEIELLRKQLLDQGVKRDEVSLGRIVDILNNNLKIAKHKSNFFDLLINEDKIIRISTTLLDKNGNILIREEVMQADFNKYIIDNNFLEPFIEENVSLEIISPVLKRGKFKWKCYYKQIPIDLVMKDNDFKDNVIQNSMVFKAGTFIDCNLKIFRKIDDVGNIINSKYEIEQVHRVHYDGIITEIKRKPKKILYETPELF